MKVTKVSEPTVTLDQALGLQRRLNLDCLCQKCRHCDSDSECYCAKAEDDGATFDPTCTDCFTDDTRIYGVESCDYYEAI